jgi:beta-RFAP synthase
MEERPVKVYVKTPARLHLGLIDMNGDLGRLFGGLGLGIDQPNVQLEAQPSSQLTVSGEKAEKVKALAKRFLKTYNVKGNVEIRVKQTIPDHIGLGSGTQLALAVASALQKLFNVKASTQELAVAMGRSQRTSVGTTIFEQGGFVVDGGKATKNGKLMPSFPPLIFRKPFPGDWRFVVAVPNTNKGLSNDEEKAAFNQLQPMPAEAVGKISRLIIMKLLPGLMEHDIHSFGEALSKIQMVVGDNFSSVQAGRYGSSIAAKGVEYLRKLGAYGMGQSSWGPAIYGLFQEQEAKEAKWKFRMFLQDSVGGKVFTAKANNKGAYIKVTQ